MKKLIGIAGLGAIALVGGIAVAQPGDQKGPQRDPAASTTRDEVAARAAARFDKLDTDSDGKLTPQDRASRVKARADGMFALLDADKNGQISRAEFDGAREKRMERREARGERGRPGMGQMAHHGGGRMGGGRGMRGGGGMGDRVDGNGDGAITKTEFQTRALAMFDRTDANKDGTVTPEERRAFRAAWRAKRAGS